MGRVNTPEKYEVQGKAILLNPSDEKYYAWYKIQAPCGLGWIRGDYCQHTTQGGGSVTPSGKRFFKSTASVRVRKVADSSIVFTFPKNRIVVGEYNSNGSRILFVSPKDGTTSVYSDASFYVDLGSAVNHTYTQRLQMLMKAEVGNSISDFGPAKDPWCQTFLNWMARQAGSSSTLYNTSGCSSMISMLGSNYQEKGSKSPSIGDWVYYTKPGSSNVAEHVGYIYSVGSSTLTTIEGNRSEADVVTEQTVNINGTTGNGTITIIGYARPPYK